MRDFCEMFAKIEANPMDIVEGLSVGEFLLAKQHAQECKECLDRIERVCAKYPDEPPTIGFGVN